VDIVVFIVLLGALILIHETGHFVLAKRAGVRVEEFGIGFPPRLVAVRRGETEYSLNLIPLGGFVRMLGEDDPSAPRSFASARRSWRIAILAAGATMNLVAAVLLFGGAYAAGWPTVTQSEILVSQVVPGSPAATAGMQPGDVIASFNGQPVQRADQLRNLIDATLGRPAPVQVVRNGKTQTLEVTPRATWPSDQGPIGIAIEDHALKVAPVYYSLPSALWHGLWQTIQTIALTITLPFLVLRGLLPLDVARPVGPLGIYQITSQATTETVATGWWFPVLSVAGTISAGLGLANLLPIPGLDGGRLLFVVIEAIRGRRINPQREGMIHFIGLAFLVSLVLVVTYFDLLNPVNLSFGPH
jgi:regulator of sigma E protease